MCTSGNRDCQRASSYSNSIRVRYDRMEQIRDEVSGDGLEGAFQEEGLPLCIKLQLECLCYWSVHHLIWQPGISSLPINRCQGSQEEAFQGFSQKSKPWYNLWMNVIGSSCLCRIKSLAFISYCSINIPFMGKENTIGLYKLLKRFHRTYSYVNLYENSKSRSFLLVQWAVKNTTYHECVIIQGETSSGDG